MSCGQPVLSKCRGDRGFCSCGQQNDLSESELKQRIQDLENLLQEAKDQLDRVREKGDVYISDADVNDVAVESEDNESEKPQPDDVYQ
jgi:hypothetical protein